MSGTIRNEELCLCAIVDDNLRPHIQGLQSNSLNTEMEKCVLISLFEVRKEIVLGCWRYHAHENYEHADSSKSSPLHEISINSRDHLCLPKIINIFLFMLHVESEFIQHAAGDVLVLISKHIALHENDWDKIIHFLCICLESVIFNILSNYSSSSLMAMSDVLDKSPWDMVSPLQVTYKKETWSVVACFLRVLHLIVKHLKHEEDYLLFRAYLKNISHFLSHKFWDLLKIPEYLESNTSGVSNDDYLLFSFQKQSHILFLGNLVQLLCSLINMCSQMDQGFYKKEVISKIIHLVPKLLHWCITDQEKCSDGCIIHYFKHKILIIMIRLLVQPSLEYSLINQWLELLHKYFEDVLYIPILQSDIYWEDGLQDSPFLPSYHIAKSISSFHLKRLAIFLFLNCCIKLLSTKVETIEKSDITCSSFCFGNDASSGIKIGNKKDVILELSRWIQGHLPGDIFRNDDIYMEECIQFSVAFTRLYIQEDDILFEVFLLLHNLPFFNNQTLVEAGGEIANEVSLISNVFNPVRLFHLFLAELSYDHHVLLDYIISKDLGIKSVEYLLRCLRAVSERWDLFEGFSSLPTSVWKRRKLCCNDGGLEGTYSAQEGGLKRREFEEAKECLLKLKATVENLDNRKLFPYNPRALLQRLKRLQELCDKHGGAPP